MFPTLDAMTELGTFEAEPLLVLDSTFMFISSPLVVPALKICFDDIAFV
jgi:hypothetical protein